MDKFWNMPIQPLEITNTLIYTHMSVFVISKGRMGMRIVSKIGPKDIPEPHTSSWEQTW